jgi:predicted lipid-binding transport protein (Tim44 family)
LSSTSARNLWLSTPLREAKMFRTAFHRLTMMAVVLGTIALLASNADARIGGGLSSGSRGGRTYSAPPPTATAPSAAPMQRSATQPGVTQPGVAGAPRPGLFGGFFNRGGMLGGFFGGLLTAGLLGMLFGHGFGGGLGGFFSFIGLIVQLGLVALIVMLVWRYFHRRAQPAYAGGHLYSDGPPVRPGMVGLAGSGGGGGRERADDVGISGADYDAFERLLGETQAAYSAEDVGALRSRATPEMVSYFSEDLAKNASRGLVSRVSDVKLLQGDLAEAWREGDTDYATVAMRFSLIDSTVERASGRVVEGDPTHPQEVSEVWTFRRSRGSPWIVSAIQQTG